MVNSSVRIQLLDKLGITKQALSQRAKKLKDAHGPMTTDEAVYVIAHMAGLDLSKHLPLATLDRIRALVPRPLPSPTAPSTPQGRPRACPAPARSYPLVSPGLASTALALGKGAYPTLFLLENSIRALVFLRLSKTGSDWWEKLAPPGVKSNVARTMKKEARFPWREKRGADPLYYANLSDLKDIIVTNIIHFSDVIVNVEWFRVQMDEAYMARNNLAHCVPLSREDETTINLLYTRWARLLDSAGVK
jgi:hypothetical protein